MTDITLEQIEAEVRRLADESPDFVYPTLPERPGNYGVNCFYVGGDAGPSCIIGQALSNLGIPEEKLAKDEGLGADSVFINLGITSSSAGAEWFEAVQNKQDSQTPWGAAVEAADVKYRGGNL